ncbi:MAG: type II toxin-antitoxin system PemK/MazF family toxin [Muribaculaceae bacterium]|nr:type II toxin-antitoxin system PemK/MazF family toxin [Muribaculaceae bacterium]
MKKQFYIFWVNLDPTVGAEMQKTRPCLIVSPDEMNDYLRTVIIVPLTSTLRELPTRVLIKASELSGLRNDSYAVLDQLKTVDKSRLSGLIGEISESEKQAVSEALKTMFDY